MAHALCPRCRVRFERSMSAHLTACPLCGEPLAQADSGVGALGLRLFTQAELVDAVPAPIAAEVAHPHPGDGRGPGVDTH